MKKENLKPSFSSQGRSFLKNDPWIGVALKKQEDEKCIVRFFRKKFGFIENWEIFS